MFHPFSQSFRSTVYSKGFSGVKPRIPDINVKFAFRLCHSSLSLSLPPRFSFVTEGGFGSRCPWRASYLFPLTPFLSLPYHPRNIFSISSKILAPSRVTRLHFTFSPPLQVANSNPPPRSSSFFLSTRSLVYSPLPPPLLFAPFPPLQPRRGFHVGNKQQTGGGRKGKRST